MHNCKWSIKVFGVYIQFTKENELQIVYQKEGQWVKIILAIIFRKPRRVRIIKTLEKNNVQYDLLGEKSISINMTSMTDEQWINVKHLFFRDTLRVKIIKLFKKKS